jgi:hypothetical protein
MTPQQVSFYKTLRETYTQMMECHVISYISKAELLVPAKYLDLK